MCEVRQLSWGRKSRTCHILFLAMFVMFLSSNGHAEIFCQISDPQDPTLNVRDSPGGSVINRLKNERVVRVDRTATDTKGRIWAEAGGIYHGNYRIWGWVFGSFLRCIDTNKFPRERISVRALQMAGIVPEGLWKTRRFPVCEGIVPNGWGVTISNELFKYYRNRGFSMMSMCIALGSDGVYFDPETGRRLNLYEIQGDTFRSLHPLWLPDCYRQIKVIAEGGYLIGWRPTGCTLRYHPSTGLPIRNPELVELSAGGEAGPGMDEDNRSSSTLTQDRLQTLLHGR